MTASRTKCEEQFIRAEKQCRRSVKINSTQISFHAGKIAEIREYSENERHLR